MGVRGWVSPGTFRLSPGFLPGFLSPGFRVCCQRELLRQSRTNVRDRPNTLTSVLAVPSVIKDSGMRSLSTKTVVVVGNGVGHDVQYTPSQNDPLLSKKRQFEEFIRKTVAEHAIQFIGEEALHGRDTIAGRLGPRWENIDMPEDLRKAQGISPARCAAPILLDEDAKTQLTNGGYQRDLGNGVFSVEPRVASDEKRERYMFERVIQASKGMCRIMLICGINHSQKLAEMFRAESTSCVEVIPWEAK